MTNKMTTEDFIAKAKKVHGDKYDYSKVDYVNSHTEVCIICPEHGDFWQKPQKHLSGQGCKKCSKRIYDTESFIKEARKVHGDKYDYSKSNFVNSRTKLCIICHEIDELTGKEHGEFWQTSGDHVNSKQGCPKCGAPNSNMTTDEFIAKARIVHGDKYDYSKTEFKKMTEEVCIICHEKDKNGNEHGEFWQLPTLHLKGCGCKKCGSSKLSATKSSTFEEFIAKARLVHGDKYDYSEVEYKNSKERVYIICHEKDEHGVEHGGFWQTPDAHIAGRGCNKCSGNYTMTKDEFIKKAKLVHGDKYDYSQIDYKNATTKVYIICHEKDAFGNEHGGFWQKPWEHLNGKGCKKCTGRYGMATEEFVAQAKLVHGDKYDYSKVEYKKMNIPVCIICHEKDVFGNEHGEFWQKPYDHLKGHGCNKCCGTKKSSTEEFVAKARLVHGDKYDYSEVKYVNNNVPVYIICHEKDAFGNEHGGFWQSPHGHLVGQGCPICCDFGTKVGKEFRNAYKISLLTENDIQKNPLDNRFFCLKSVEILALIKAGVLPKDFMSIARTPRGSRARLEAIQTLISTIESGEETEITEESNDVEGNTSMDVESVETLEAVERIDEETNDSELVVDETTGLPILDDHTNVLRNGDINGLDKLSPTSENGKFIVANTIQTWWQIVSDDEDFVNEIRNYHGSKFYDYIKEEFFKEYNAIITMPKPEGYSLPYELYPYQKILAHKLETRSSYSLWLDMGGGKTYSAINASRHNGLKNTMVVAPKSVLEESWISSVYEMFPDSNVIAFFGETKNDFKVKVTAENFASAKAYNHWIDTNVTLIHNINEFQKTDGKYTYFLINYDKFSQSYAKELVNTIVNKCEIDYVILDEIQKVKYRESTGEVSSRHQHVGFLLSEIRKRNPLVKASALTGTPLINELSEVKSIIELVSGEEVSGIKNNRVNIGNVSEANKAIVLNGFRYRPVINVKHVLITPEIDCDAELEKTIRELANRKSYYGELESALAIAKIKNPDVIKEIKPGTIIYVLYPYKNNTATEIIRKVESLGFKVGAYLGCTPNKHEVFEDFVNGKTDVLVASSPISIGVNGLQNRSDRMIIISLPQTNADYEQLIKRIVRKRKGDSLLGEKDVTIIVPQIILELNDDDDSDEDDWSWDRSRMNALLYKKNLGDAVMDGDIQKVFRIDWNKLYRNAMKRLKEGVKDESEIVKNKVVVLEPEEREKREYSASVVNNMHRLANTSNHGTMHKYFQDHPEAFQTYHEHRNTENWVEDPVDYIASFINGHYSNKKIADLGCGKNKLSTLMKNGNTVTGFDHMRVEGHDEVVVADIANLNGIVKDKEFDIALFCLSLWGKDYEDYFNEANRILKNNGRVIVVEPNDCFGDGEKYGDESEFINLVEKHGFYRIGGVTKRNGFSYFRFLKED